MSILHKSTKEVKVTNHATTKGTYKSGLLFDQLPPKARETTPFEEFPHSLISIGKMATSSFIPIFTRKGVPVHNEEDVLITCKGDAILVWKQEK